jgi:glycosyltransferase involved in cell wall biosynthesis
VLLSAAGGILAPDQATADRSEAMDSLIIPVYKNAENIPELLSALASLHARASAPVEVVFVVDGSPDASEALLRARLPQAPFPSQLICHSRNFGAFAAIRTGMTYAQGERMAVMAADLQEPLDLALEFFRVLREEPFDVCVGTRMSRKDPWQTRLSSQGFWFLYRRLVMSNIPPGGIDVFGCTRDVARVVTSLEESHSSLVAQIIWVGFRRKDVPYDRLPRKVGRSSWSLRRRIAYMLDSIFSFTDRPLHLISFMGAMGMLFSIVYAAVVVVAKWNGWIKEAGYSTLVVLILFSMFLNLFSLGIVGQYVWRTFENTKGRPLSIVRDATSFSLQPVLSAKD